MNDVEGYALAKRWEDLAERFKPLVAGDVITVVLTSDEARLVHEALVDAVAALVAEIEADAAAVRSPKLGGTVSYALACLRREDPGLAARVERGELSVDEAAVAMGWQSPPG